MNWFAENMAESLVVLGLALLVIEILVLGFATFILLFVGIAAIITGGLLYMAVIPDTLFAAMLSIAVCTGLSALLLWKPLRNMQQDIDPQKARNDLIGHRFTLTDTVSKDSHPQYKFSGIMWKLSADEEIAKGVDVEVVDTKVGELRVRAVN